MGSEEKVKSIVISSSPVYFSRCRDLAKSKRSGSLPFLLTPHSPLPLLLLLSLSRYRDSIIRSPTSFGCEQNSMSNDPTRSQPAPKVGSSESLTPTEIAPLEMSTMSKSTELLVVPKRLGPYELKRELGSGGMGMVYEAVDVMLNRPIALKILRPSLLENLESRERFLREARAAAALNHPNVVRIYHVGEDQHIPFIAMELLQGETLEDRLERQGSLTVPESVSIARQVAEALAAAHVIHLIHRDIKPANIWLQPGDELRVVLLDFGLALDVVRDIRLTQTGYVMGTPAYMSPEQTRGIDLDSRTDLFSLGCVLYQAITGQRPFRGDSLPKIARSMQVDTVPALSVKRPSTPASLSALVERMLAKERDQRPTSAEAVAGELKAIERELTPTPKSGEMIPQIECHRYRNAFRIVLALLTLVMIAFAAFFYGFYRGTLVVECDDPAIEVRVRKGSSVPIERSFEREFRLLPGEYVLELVQLQPDLIVHPPKVQVEMGGRTTVRVHRGE